MRAKSALINSMSGLVYQVVNMIIGFFIPRYIINIYGSEINGLTSNIQQYINILSLLQAGLVAASGSEMYKPIASGDNETVGRIYYSDKNYFNKMSYVYLALAMTIIPAMLIGKVETISREELLISILIMAVNGYLTFKYCCCYDLMFSIYQKKYILYGSFFAERIVYYIILVISLKFQFNYNLMYIGYLLGTIVKLIFLRCFFKRLFEHAIIEYKGQTGYKIKNQYYVLGEQIIFRLMDTVPILIVTKLYNLGYASIYSVYVMIISAFKGLFDIVQNAITPSFGDMYARYKEKGHVADVFDMIQSICFVILNILSICLSVLFLPFINIYIGKNQSYNYVCSGIVLFIGSHMVMYVYFFLYNMITNAAGLYKKFFRGNVVIGVFSVLISIICAKVDFQLVYIGITVYYLLAMIQRYYIIKNEIMPLGLKCIARPIVSMLIYFISFYIFSDMIFNIIGANITKWILSAIISGVLGVFISLIISLMIDKRQLIKVLEVVSNLMKRRRME